MRTDSREPVVVSYGAGVDSTAMLIGMHRRGERPDAILFADTGGEKPETYHYAITVFRQWLREVGFPDLTVVRKRVTRFANAAYLTLQGNCIANRTYPSLAFARKGCSQKWKAEPMDAWVKHHCAFRRVLDAGRRVQRLIGYDDGPADARRGKKPSTSEHWRFRFPLREWGWDREHCKRVIADAGLPVPLKSACWFCPASKPAEIRWLAQEHPDLAEGIVAIERHAAPRQVGRRVQGLWGTGTKGCRGAERKPAAMTDFIRELQVIDVDVPVTTCGVDVPADDPCEVVQ